MKKFKPTITVALVVALIAMFAGVYANMSYKQKLLDNVNYIDNSIADIVLEIENDLNNMDTVALRDKDNKLEVLQQEIITMRDEYNQNKTEYKMYEEINMTIEYLQEMIHATIYIIENPFSLFLDTTAAQLETYANKIEEHKENYENLKNELGIEQVEEVEIEVNEL